MIYIELGHSDSRHRFTHTHTKAHRAQYQLIYLVFIINKKMILFIKLIIIIRLEC
jgi:hypothetical protein